MGVPPCRPLALRPPAPAPEQPTKPQVSPFRATVWEWLEGKRKRKRNSRETRPSFGFPLLVSSSWPSNWQSEAPLLAKEGARKKHNGRKCGWKKPEDPLVAKRIFQGHLKKVHPQESGTWLADTRQLYHGGLANRLRLGFSSNRGTAGKGPFETARAPT